MRNFVNLKSLTSFDRGAGAGTDAGAGAGAGAGTGAGAGAGDSVVATTIIA